MDRMNLGPNGRARMLVSYAFTLDEDNVDGWDSPRIEAV